MSRRAKVLGPKWPRKLKPVRQPEWWERPIADIYRGMAANVEEMERSNLWSDREAMKRLVRPADG